MSARDGHRGGAFSRDYNEEWNAWVDHQNPPVRACVEAQLTHKGLLVEIMVTAAR